MCFVVTVFTLSNIESNKSKCCPGLPMRSSCIYITILFLRRQGFGQEFFFVSVLVWDSRNYNFLVKSLRSSAVFGVWLRRPSPCLIRSAPRREREWGQSETSEKCVFFPCILGGIRPSYYWSLAYAELERINQKRTFPNWHVNFFPTTLFSWPPRIACPIVATTAVCRSLSAQWV